MTNFCLGKRIDYQVDTYQILTPQSKAQDISHLSAILIFRVCDYLLAKRSRYFFFFFL